MGYAHRCLLLQASHSAHMHTASIESSILRACKHSFPELLASDAASIYEPDQQLYSRVAQKKIDRTQIALQNPEVAVTNTDNVQGLRQTSMQASQ